MNLDVFVAIGVGVVLLIAWVRRDTPQRHARYRLRVQLARWLMDGKLTEARVRKGRLLVSRRVSVRGARRGRTAQRGKVLSVVRRDDQSA